MCIFLCFYSFQSSLSQFCVAYFCLCCVYCHVDPCVEIFCVVLLLCVCCHRKRLPTPTAVLVGTPGATWARTHTFKKQQTTKTNKPPYMPIKKHRDGGREGGGFKTKTEIFFQRLREANYRQTTINSLKSFNYLIRDMKWQTVQCVKSNCEQLSQFFFCSKAHIVTWASCFHTHKHYQIHKPTHTHTWTTAVKAVTSVNELSSQSSCRKTKLNPLCLVLQRWCVSSDPTIMLHYYIIHLDFLVICQLHKSIYLNWDSVS